MRTFLVSVMICAGLSTMPAPAFAPGGGGSRPAAPTAPAITTPQTARFMSPLLAPVAFTPTTTGLVPWSVERLAAIQARVDPALVAATCHWETRGERVRGTADSALGDRRRSVGRCQVKIGTAAWQIGYTARDLRRHPELETMIRRMLHDPLLNAHFAAQELRWCLDRWEGWPDRLERAVYCYQAGRRAPYQGPTLGTKNVLLPYGQEKLREAIMRQWALNASHGGRT